MHRGRIAGSALACALAAGATLGAPALVAHAASFTSTVTSGLLNQGTLPGGWSGLPGGQSGTTQTFGQGGGTPAAGGSQGSAGGSQGSAGGSQGSTGGSQGSAGGAPGTTSAVSGSVTSSGGVTSGRFYPTSGSQPSILFPQGGSSGSSTLSPPPQQGGSTPSQSGGASTTPGSGSPQNELQYVLGLVNGQRRQVDAQPLVLDAALTTLAQERAQAMAANNVISHDVPGYGYPDAMETAAGITGTLIGGEDIATGLTVDEAFWNLVTSPWHDANMLFASYNTVGIGVATMPNGTYVLDLLFIER